MPLTPSPANMWASLSVPSSAAIDDVPPGVDHTSDSIPFDSSASVAQHIGCTAIAKPPIHTPKLVDSEEYIGIELELENCNSSSFRTAVNPEWEAVTDGSLKLNGMEYRFRQPLAGAAIVKALKKFETALVLLDAAPYHEGHRGSTHFHINVSNSSVPELYYQILLSYFVEPVLLAMCKPDRRHNSFAVPSGRTKDTIEVLDRIRAGQFMFNETAWKYRAVGLNSIYSKGSLEYRMFHSTHDMEEVLGWTNAVLSIKKASRKFADKIPDMIKRGLAESPQTIIDEIFNGIYDFSPYYDQDDCPDHLWEFTRMFTYSLRDEMVMSSKVSDYYKKVMGV